MDVRDAVGKTVVFALICLFVSWFTGVFGQDNYLVGVVAAVLAMTMLGRDMSARPLLSLAVMLVCFVSMGLCSFVSVWVGIPAVGAVVNFAFVFCVCFVSTRDLNTPMHFPFLLGYTFMLSVPVGPEGLPDRIAAIAVGACAVVALNVAFNLHGRRGRDRRELIAICEEVRACCVSSMAGGKPVAVRLDDLCSRLNIRLYGRLRGRLVSHPGDRRLMDTVMALRAIGADVCDGRIPPDGVYEAMGRIIAFLNGGSGREAVESVDRIIGGGSELEYGTRAALDALRDGILRYSTRSEDYDTEDVPRGLILRAYLGEVLRSDSARMTFSFRMALLFAACAFLWKQTGNDNLKPLVFAVIAMVQPYVEGAWERTAERMLGTVAGIAAAIAALLLASGDETVLTAVLLLANYLFSVLSPMRYGVTMAFVTLSSLLTASLTVPPEAVMTERVAMVFAGLILAYAANRAVFPYRMADGNRALIGRYLGIVREQFAVLAGTAEGREDRHRGAALVLTAATISSKLRMNINSRRDMAAEVMLARLNTLSARVRLLTDSVDSVDTASRSEASAAIRAFLDGGASAGPALASDGADEGFLADVRDVLDSFRDDVSAFGRLVPGTAPVKPSAQR